MKRPITKILHPEIERLKQVRTSVQNHIAHLVREQERMKSLKGEQKLLSVETLEKSINELQLQVKAAVERKNELEKRIAEYERELARQTQPVLF